MKSSTFTVSDLFSSHRRYVVPIFQRAYVWSEERQWQPLWEDILDKTHEILASERHQRTLRSHFLGAVVINQIPTYGRQVQKMEVVDGQQRITTLQILFLALRDYARAMEANDVFHRLEQLTTNSMLREDEIERYKVWPTTSDQPAFQKIYQAGSQTALEQRFPPIKSSRRGAARQGHLLPGPSRGCRRAARHPGRA